MFWDDLGKLLRGRTLYRLEAVVAPRLVPLLYAFGLAALLLWAVDHLFGAFAFSFGQGLWGILEVVVYGPLWLIALRIACELVLVFFAAQDITVAAVERSRGRNTLAEDVGDAIRDLAEDDVAPEPPAAPFTGRPVDVDPIIKGTVPRRSARRTPPAQR